ncbi:glycine cleavage T C-terminal barrel domain-containing protein [Conexibacter stalactiti]|uniref:Glycine cleavage T C-terminal barrel domain-containing protein n=1 Tax=Conexibacter stalactiti TaxID=1940611 RepID=A0ABU4HM22_9ACTN|nr:glycine cleavage T C-terminal barrel domain-containing protein [Conexibacter stalactiti]MDW5594351.1 glycine cleavage T C-terminal barrel domain-containing protein [Conexibacter stalactiti]MEC5034993.1 glycine cleavage T C-terminal barrel domain-containing protein [Conexibacter stalactiti]
MGTTEQLSEAERAVRAGAGLVDRSARGKLALSGGETKRFLQGQITNDVVALEPGQGLYAAFLTAKGKMLGDLRVLDSGDELLLDTERVALQELFNMVRRYSLGFDVELHRRTLERGLLSLVGPRARALLGDAAAGLGEQEHAHVATTVDGIPVRLIATDVGVDLLLDSARTEALAQALVARGALPVSDEVVETMRIERGRPRYGVELDDSTIPQEAGLNERAVSFTKGCYVGQETVARLFYKGKPNRHLRGLRLAVPVEPGSELTLDGKRVGTVGSVAVSPVHGPIALALVRREAEPGSTVTVGETTAEVAELPF